MGARLLTKMRGQLYFFFHNAFTISFDVIFFLYGK